MGLRPRGQTMLEIAFKSVITVGAIVALYFFWTSKVDVGKTLLKPFSFITFNKEARLDLDYQQILGAQCNGRPSFVFYTFQFVNSSDDNLTVKQILVRYHTASGERTVDSTVIDPGEVVTPKGNVESIMIHSRSRGANIMLMNWKNFRPVLGEFKTLSPGAVLSGSAVFVLDGITLQDLKQLKRFQVVAIDFSGNEVVKDIDVKPEWVAHADDLEVASRAFTAKGQEITWH